MTLYEAAWRLFLCFLIIVGGIGALWLALEISIGYFLDQAESARKRVEGVRRRYSYNCIAHRYGRWVR